jgi:hypothetical protein
MAGMANHFALGTEAVGVWFDALCILATFI